jgi:hypothetical protein
MNICISINAIALASRTYRHEVIILLDKVVKRVFHSGVVERRMLQTEQSQPEQPMRSTTRIVRQMETKF